MKSNEKESSVTMKVLRIIALSMFLIAVIELLGIAKWFTVSDMETEVYSSEAVDVGEFDLSKCESLLSDIIAGNEKLNGKLKSSIKEVKEVGDGYIIIADHGDDEKFCPGFILTKEYEYTGLFRWNGAGINEDIVAFAIESMD